MQFAFLLIINLISISFCVFFIIHFAQKLKIQSKRQVIFLLCILILWTTINIADMFAVDLERKILLTNIGYIAYALLSPCWISFVKSFILRKSQNRSFFLVFFYTVGAAFVLLNWINPANLFYSSVDIVEKGGHWVFAPKYGIIFWFYWAYSILLLIGTLPWMARLTISGKMKKTHFVLLVAAILSPTIANTFYITGVFYYDSTSLAFWLTSLLLYFLYKKDFFSRLPLSHDSIISNMNMGYILMTTNLQLLEINEAARKSLRLNETYSNSQVEDIITNEWRLSPNIIEMGDTLRSLKEADGTPRYYRINANKFSVGNKNEEYYALFIQDETDLQSIRKRMQYLERYDEPTGLYNHSYFFELVDKELSRFKDEDTHMIVLACIQIMNYHNCCNLLGNDMCDLIVRAVSEVFEELIRSRDALCRLSSNELCLFMRFEKTDNIINRIERIIESALAKFEQPLKINGKLVKLKISIGVAFAPKHARTSTELLNAANIALRNIAKFAQKSYRIYHEDSGENFTRRLKLDSDMHRAIEEGQFFVLYQPQVDIRNGVVTGVEALVRWQHPELGLIPPSDFITLAEENGMIRPLGLWVIREAVKQQKIWQDMGLVNLKVSVNVSLNQLPDPNFSNDVIDIVDAAGVNPSRLELELTESIALFPEAMAHGHLARLRGHNIRIAMDDFGMGHSSLAFIKDFEPSTIKIDRALSSDIMINPASIAMIRSVNTLCNTLSVETVVEYIEHKEQLEILKDLQCFIVQGYLFSRPLKAEDCTNYIINADINARKAVQI